MIVPTELPLKVEIHYTKPLCRKLVLDSFHTRTFVLLTLFYLSITVGIVFGFMSWIEYHSPDYLYLSFMIFMLFLPWLIYHSWVEALYHSLNRLGLGKTLTLMPEDISWQWKNQVISTAPWSTFHHLQKNKKLWMLYLDKRIALYLPTDQLPLEAQTFMLEKLTEYNVPIKG